MLSAKEYFKLKGLNTPDFVLLFIPIEPSFSLAMHEDPGIYNHAFDKNILLVTPTTLIGALRVISVIWKQEKQNRNVNEIAKEAGGMLDKFQGFVEDMKKSETLLRIQTKFTILPLINFLREKEI